jgi:hypothetical protein
VRHAPLIAVVLLSATAVLADDIPSPSAIGSGTSDQSVSLAGGAVSAGVESGGSLDTDTGETSGHLGVSVDVLGTGAGIGVSSPSASGNELPGEAAAPAAVAPGDTAAASSACEALTGLPLSVGQIVSLRPAGLRVATTCDGARFGHDGRAAVARNAELGRHLAASGIAVSDIRGLAISGDGTTLLVTRADASAAE